MSATAGSAPPCPHDAGFHHGALFHRDDHELVARAVPFLTEGLERREAVLIRLPEAQRRAVVEALHDPPELTVLDVPDDVGPFSLLAHDRGLVRDRLDDGATAVRLLAAAPVLASRRCPRYEAALGHHHRGLPLSQMCTYDAAAATWDVLLDAVHTHDALVSSNGRRDTSGAVDPGSILHRCSDEEADVLERRPPGIHLVDPSYAELTRAVEHLGRQTNLSTASVDAMRIAAGMLDQNAHLHGAPPVEIRGWAADDRLVLIVSDGGKGFADPFVGLTPSLTHADGTHNSLFLVNDMISVVGAFTDRTTGFAVRLIEYEHPQR